MAIVDVTSLATLNTAVNAALPGDLIRCAAGTYGDFSTSKQFAAPGIEITSLDQSNRPVFGQMQFNNAAGIKVSYIRQQFVYTSQPDNYPMLLINTSQRIKYYFNELYGANNGSGYGWGRGVNIEGGTAATNKDNEIVGNKIKTFFRGMVLSGCGKALIQGNEIWDINSDAIDAPNTDQITFLHNYVHDHRTQPGSGAHGDGIQVFSGGSPLTGITTNFTAKRNIFNSGNGSYFETLFLRNESVDQGLAPSALYQNFVIEDNWSRVSHKWGIFMGECQNTSIKNNVFIWAPMNMSDPWNAADGRAQSDTVFVPTIQLGPQTGTVVFTGNRCYGAPQLTASRFVTTGSTAGWSISDNVTDVNATGPAQPTFTLGGDGLGGGAAPSTITGAGASGRDFVARRV